MTEFATSFQYPRKGTELKERRSGISSSEGSSSRASSPSPAWIHRPVRTHICALHLLEECGVVREMFVQPLIHTFTVPSLSGHQGSSQGAPNASWVSWSRDMQPRWLLHCGQRKLCFCINNPFLCLSCKQVREDKLCFLAMAKVISFPFLSRRTKSWETVYHLKPHCLV